VGGNAQTKAMKKVAGRLRLDLAQYRELEAFAQFGSELDAATKRQLIVARGLEVLAAAFADGGRAAGQIIYAVTNGFLDDVAVNRIRDWERGFHDFMAAQAPQVGDALRKEKALSKDTEAALKQGIEAYKKTVK
jgi:F-type H+-transporting ATPase subunit alpha